MIERRKDCRRRALLGADIRHHSLPSLMACTVRNQSDGGVQICLGEMLPLPDRFDLSIAGREAPLPVELIWRQGDAVGLRFLPQTELDLARHLAERLLASEAENARLRECLAAAAADSTRH